MKTEAAPEPSVSSTVTWPELSASRSCLKQLHFFGLWLLQSCLDLFLHLLALLSWRLYYCLESSGPGQLLAQMPSCYCYSEAPCRGNIKMKHFWCHMLPYGVYRPRGRVGVLMCMCVSHKSPTAQKLVSCAQISCLDNQGKLRSLFLSWLQHKTRMAAPTSRLMKLFPASGPLH